MSCSDTTRRQFLRQSSCIALAVAGVGISPGELMAMPVGSASGSGSGSERRYPIPSKDGVTVDHDSYIILVRYAGKMFALALACPHESAVVKWVAKDRRFQCSKHDSEYTPAGDHIEGRATRNMDRLAIHKDGASMVVNLSQVYKSDADPSGWASAVADV